MELEEGMIYSHEAARLLGIHRYTLNRWILKSKKDKYFRCPSYYFFGGCYRFRKSDIDNFLNECLNKK